MEGGISRAYGHLIGSVRKNLYSAPAIIRAPDFTGRTFDGRRIMSRKDNEKKETKPRKTEETSIGREIWEYVKMIAIVVAVVVFVEQVIVINARIPSPSMENTIMTGDQIFGNRLAYVKSDPQRYDIVIFYYPDDEKQKFIKRVIGLPLADLLGSNEFRETGFDCHSAASKPVAQASICLARRRCIDRCD